MVAGLVAAAASIVTAIDLCPSVAARVSLALLAGGGALVVLGVLVCVGAWFRVPVRQREAALATVAQRDATIADLGAEVKAHVEREARAARRKELRRKLMELYTRPDRHGLQQLTVKMPDRKWEIAESWVNEVADLLEEHGASDKAQAFRVKKAEREIPPSTLIAERQSTLRSWLDYVDDPLWND